MTMNKFYVYGYFREDGTPYYIGKGCGKRAWYRAKRVKPPVDQARIKILAENLSEEEAFEWEKDLISLLGRKDNGTGCLRNLTDGGEGASGYHCTAEHKASLSTSMAGKIKTESHKRAISEALEGRSKTLDHRLNIAAAKSIARRWNHSEHGLLSCSAQELARQFNLHTGALSRVVSGAAKQHKGWRVVL